MGHSKNTYFHVDLERGTIRFPTHVSSASVEAVLSEAYKKSFQKKYTTICFDFNRVVWCDLLPITLIVNWILSLGVHGKVVEFYFPADHAVQRFLSSYRFEKFLDEQQVSKSGNKTEGIRLNPNNLLRAPFFPLTFFTEQSFRSLLQDLYYGDRLGTVFAGVEEAEVVKTGAVRDVILFELGDNIYMHTNGQGAHIAMTKYHRKSIRKGAHPLDEVDARFFDKLHGQEVLEIVISDNGEGLFKTLQSAYIADATITNKPSAPTDCDVIDYALLYYTSRRSVTERIGRIRDVIESDALKFPPPTGLSRLKETVRDYHGLLYIRSGDGIVAYDFYDNQNHDIPFRSDRLPKNYTLCPVKGTQCRIVLPVRKPLALGAQTSFPFHTGMGDETGSYEFLGVAEYFRKRKPADLQSAAEALDEIFHSLNAFGTAYKGKHLTIIVDFQDCEQVFAKALHYLIYDLMQRQGKLQSNIIINLPADSDTLHLSNVQDSSLLPLQVYDNKGRFHMLGVSEKETHLAEEVFSNRNVLSDPARRFAENKSHICVFNERIDRYVPRSSYKQVIRISKEAIGKKLRTGILEQVFDPSIKVLLPSQRYCTGYFETYRIYAEATLYGLLKRYLYHSLLEDPPDYIISIGAEVGLWVSNVLSEQPLSPKLQKRHINLPTSSKGTLPIAPILGIEKECQVVIITDVLGTCKTVQKLLTNISQTQVTKIITIVNASEHVDAVLQFREKEIKIEAIVRKKLRYYYDLPPGWSYADIHQVDSHTHLLVKNASKIEGPLFKGISFEDQGGIPINEFFRDIIEPSNGIREGHFYSKSSHIIYLFDIPKINSLFIDQISDIIVNDIREVENVLTDDRKASITHVLYPHYNPGMDIFAKRVASPFPGCSVVTISEEELQPSFDQDYEINNIHKVVVLDDASVTGETIFRMVDICERMGAQFIYVYIIIKRSDPYIARRLEKSKQYGRSGLHVRYLMDAELPSYTPDKCPLCKDNDELEALRTMFPKNAIISKYFEDRAKDQELQPVGIVLQETKLLSFPSATHSDLLSLKYRWLIERAKSDPAARHALAEVIRDYKSTPSNVLILFFVLSREKIPSTLSEKIRKVIFYKSFCEDIINACRYFLEDPCSLSTRDFRSVLYISGEFDPYYISDNCFTMFSMCSHCIPTLMDLAVHSMRSRVFRDHPAIVTNSLRVLSDTKRGEKELCDMTDALVEYWEKYEANIKQHKANRLAAYEDLRGGVFHEIQHLRTNLTSVVGDLETSSEDIKREWEPFRIEIDKILTLVRRCIAFDVKTNTCYELDTLVSSINFQLGEGNGIIENKDISDKQVRDQVHEIAERLTELLFGKKGVRVVLNSFESNFKSITLAILQQHEENFRSKNISAKRSFPEELCVVYGEDSAYKLMLHNLVENVWKWSKGSMLFVEGEIVESERSFILRVLDDGVGLEDKMKIGHGLRNVKSIVNRYYGEFDNQSEILERYRTEGYTTLATVKLPYLRPIKEDKE
jgi:signal transduction histidine kinase